MANVRVVIHHENAMGWIGLERTWQDRGLAAGNNKESVHTFSFR